jgi:hypothetical protein
MKITNLKHLSQEMYPIFKSLLSSAEKSVRPTIESSFLRLILNYIYSSRFINQCALSEVCLRIFIGTGISDMALIGI